MDIPLLVLAAIYFLLFLIWIVLTLINVYHVLRYALWNKVALVFVFVYLLFSAGVVGVTGWTLRDVNWKENISIDTPDITIPVDLPGSGHETNNQFGL